MIINLISGPRNISTALMYSFAQRSDTKVVDEPFYAHYLIHTGLNHPGRQATIESQSADPHEVLREIELLEKTNPIVFLKNMAHHHEGLDLSYLTSIHNVFLIRDPHQLIASFAQVIPEPTLQDIGLKHEADLLEYIQKNGTHKPIVVDSNDVLSDPSVGLERLCKALAVPFEGAMLSWESGPLPEDGSWAKYWYANVHRSTGFAKQKTSDRPLPEHCQKLYEKALPYYNKLKTFTASNV